MRAYGGFCCRCVTSCTPPCLAQAPPRALYVHTHAARALHVNCTAHALRVHMHCVYTAGPRPPRLDTVGCDRRDGGRGCTCATSRGPPRPHFHLPVQPKPPCCRAGQSVASLGEARRGEARRGKARRVGKAWRGGREGTLFTRAILRAVELWHGWFTSWPGDRRALGRRNGVLCWR